MAATTGAVTGAGLATGAGAATVDDSSFAVSASTAWVSASILASRDIKFLLRITGYRGVDGDAIFDERIDEFTQNLARCPELSGLDVKPCARLV
jgi:hypothetical protein